MTSTHTEAAVKLAIVAALTSERVGGRDPSGLETTVAVYPDEAAAVADEVLDTLRNSGGRS